MLLVLLANVSMDFDILVFFVFFFPADLHMDLYMIVLRRTRLFLHCYELIGEQNLSATLMIRQNFSSKWLDELQTTMYFLLATIACMNHWIEGFHSFWDMGNWLVLEYPFKGTGLDCLKQKELGGRGQ